MFYKYRSRIYTGLYWNMWRNRRISPINIKKELALFKTLHYLGVSYVQLMFSYKFYHMTITFRNVSQFYSGCHFSQKIVQNLGACVKIFLLSVSNGIVMEGQLNPARWLLCVKRGFVQHSWHTRGFYIT
jgi:hypothetical protein